MWVSQTRHVFISKSSNKPELLWRRNATTSYDSSWLWRENRRVAFLKHRAVIEIPFPHETADRHNWWDPCAAPCYPARLNIRSHNATRYRGLLWRCDNLNPKNIEPTRRNKFRTTKPKMNELADRLAFSTYQPHSELAPGRKVPRRNDEKSWGELHFKTCERPPSDFGERWK